MSRFTNHTTISAGKKGGDILLMTSAATDNGQMKQVAGARADALKLLERASAQLGAKSLSSKVKEYAARYFLTGKNGPDPTDLRIIKTILTKTWNGLNGDVALKIGDLGAGTLGEVSGKFNRDSAKPYHSQTMFADTGRIERAGAIKIADKVMSDGYQGVLTLIHEATHKYAGTMDYCYFEMDGKKPEAGKTFNSKDFALVNADSHAWFYLKIGRSYFSSFNTKMYT